MERVLVLAAAADLIQRGKGLSRPRCVLARVVAYEARLEGVAVRRRELGSAHGADEVDARLIGVILGLFGGGGHYFFLLPVGLLVLGSETLYRYMQTSFNGMESRALRSS